MLMGYEHGDFLNEGAEFIGPGVFVAENRNLVLDQRVVEDGYVFHKIKSSSFFYLFSGV